MERKGRTYHLDKYTVETAEAIATRQNKKVGQVIHDAVHVYSDNLGPNILDDKTSKRLQIIGIIEGKTIDDYLITDMGLEQITKSPK